MEALGEAPEILQTAIRPSGGEAFDSAGRAHHWTGRSDPFGADVATFVASNRQGRQRLMSPSECECKTLTILEGKRVGLPNIECALASVPASQGPARRLPQANMTCSALGQPSVAKTCPSHTRQLAPLGRLGSAGRARLKREPRQAGTGWVCVRVATSPSTSSLWVQCPGRSCHSVTTQAGTSTVGYVELGVSRFMRAGSSFRRGVWAPCGLRPGRCEVEMRERTFTFVQRGNGARRQRLDGAGWGICLGVGHDCGQRARVATTGHASALRDAHSRLNSRRQTTRRPSRGSSIITRSSCGFGPVSPAMNTQSSRRRGVRHDGRGGIAPWCSAASDPRIGLATRGGAGGCGPPRNVGTALNGAPATGR